MKTIVGLFDDMAQAQQASRDLEQAGIARNDISIVANNENARYASHDGAGHTETTTTGGAIGTDAAIGATLGGATGLVIALTGLAVPGLGWVATAGWLTATLVGAGTGALVGGLVGALTSVGVPEEDASLYNEGVRRGGILLAVRAQDNEAHRVAQILENDGAVDIDERAAQYRQGAGAVNPLSVAGTSGTVPAMGANMNRQGAANANMAKGATQGEAVIPVIEETLQVGKREVQRGGVRVFSHVTETPVREQVTLREEHVTVERNTVDRPLTPADREALRDQTVVVTARSEEPVIAKEARVVEEVVVGKEASERTQTVEDTVRHTAVEVEQIPGQTTAGTMAGANRGATTDTRGVGERVADAVTGDHTDDKTGKRV